MSVTIVLRGRHYTVRSDEPEEDVLRVARWADRQVAEVARRTPGVDGETVALLAGLNMASEYFRFRKRMVAELGELDQELAAVAAILDVALPGVEEPSDVEVLVEDPGSEE